MYFGAEISMCIACFLWNWLLFVAFCDFRYFILHLSGLFEAMATVAVKILITSKASSLFTLAGELAQLPLSVLPSLSSSNTQKCTVLPPSLSGFSHFEFFLFTHTWLHDMCGDAVINIWRAACSVLALWADKQLTYGLCIKLYIFSWNHAPESCFVLFDRLKPIFSAKTPKC